MLISRERVRKALAIEEPDRVPIDLGSLVGTLTFEAQQRLKEYLSIGGKEEIYNRVEGTVIPNEEILKYLKVDTRYIYLNSPSGWKDIELGNGIYEDEFGVRRKKASWYYDLVHSPLANAKYPEEIEEHPWPDPRERVEGTKVFMKGQNGYMKIHLMLLQLLIPKQDQYLKIHNA